MARCLLALVLLPSLALAAPPERARAGGIGQTEADLQECEDDVDSLLVEVEELEASCAVAIATPEQGGATTSTDGAASLLVPPLAVQAPTDLSIALIEAQDDDRLLTDVYDFGPDATRFERNVTICLDIEPQELDDGERVCLAYLDEASDPPQWTCEDECLEKTGEGTLCGQTSHFTNFALLLNGGDGEPSTCDDDDDVFLDGRTGGVVTSADDLAFISVPPLSFPEPTPVFVEPVVRPIVDVPRASGVYDIGPDGLFFRNPATVCLTAPDAPPTACLGYFDASTRKWTCEDKCLETSGDTVCGQTSHLTNFAILLEGGLSRDECREL